MIRIVLLTTAILTGVVVTGNAEAQGRPDARPAFSALDADGDGKVTPAEMQAYGAARAADHFARADTDANGALSETELRAAAEKAPKGGRGARHVTRMLKRLDSDNSGDLTLAEFQSRPQRQGKEAPDSRILARFDTDKDGALSAAEYSAIPERGDMRRPRG